MDPPEDESTARAVPEHDQWDRLLNEQTALFRKTTSRNNELESRVAELERELNVWKVAHKASDEEKNALSKKVFRLERSIGSLKDDNPLILCLIDGDGTIFAPELIRSGHAGGRQAAQLLTQGLTEHMSTLETERGSSTGRGEIWLTIYCNKKGLTETLTSNNVCTAEEFEQFIMGFNQAAPLFSFVDVGIGKEAADSKIKECLRVFTRFPQTTRVFFGGAHDNGYTATLNYLQNEGLNHKLIILRGYKNFAPELRSLHLPYLEIEGLFLKDKLLTNSHKKTDTPVMPNREISYMVQPQDFDKFRNRSTTPQAQVLPTKKPRKPVPNLPLHKHKPPPCNYFYLSSCKHGDGCRYSHDYELPPARLEELRANAKKWPCPYLNSGHECPHGEEGCCMAHWCPYGPKCSYLKAKTCKFRSRMHRFDQTNYIPGNPFQMSISARSISPNSTHLHFPGSPMTNAASDEAYNDVPVSPFGGSMPWE